MDNETKTKKRIATELGKYPEGLTIIDLASRLGISRQTASRYVLPLISEGIIKIRKIGPAKLCYLKKQGKKSGK